MRRFKEQGAVLFLVLVMITIIIGISSCLFLGSRLNFKLAANIAAAKKSLYAAEAGIEYGKYLVCQVYQGLPPQDLNGNCYRPGRPFLRAYPLNNGSNFTLVYDQSQKPTELIIVAEGEYQGVKQKIRVVVGLKDG
ncbi:MAG: pilus assembly PilX N-terminal domain-containing protein [Halanaerobiales bacterium]|nr:pilus assembly PilX N-terminal domain-containing protein [Halanaerobiales bacterium]